MRVTYFTVKLTENVSTLGVIDFKTKGHHNGVLV